MKPQIIIIDDEPAICESLEIALEGDYQIFTTQEPKEAIRMIKEKPFQVAIIDLKIGTYDGIELLREIKKINKTIAAIMITAYGSIRSSVEAMKSGAFNYISKPLDIEELRIYIEQALEIRRLNEKIYYLDNKLKSRYKYGDMIGKSPEMQKVYEQIERLKSMDINILITGESGTGKDLVAQALHYLGKRKDERFIVVNCAAIPEGLLESDFFGYKRGSFTGAVMDKKGKFEVADKGTIFLDEIGDMPISLQSKLLRVLEQKEISAIGSNEVRKVDVHVIAATNRNLKEMVLEGKFREDLYFRLNVFEIKLPPLKERKQDIPLLCEFFISNLRKEKDINVEGISKEAQRALLTYDYPGNVRELSNIIEYAVVMAESENIQINDLPQHVIIGGTQIEKKPNEYNKTEKLTLEEIEKAAILNSLLRNNGHRGKTAEELGISERGLRYKIKEYDLANKLN